MISNIFTENIVLENERVLLGPIQENDFENLLPYSLQEPEIWKYGLITAAGEENLRNYINAAVKNSKEEKEYPFIVFDKKANAFVGSTRFYDIQQPYLTVLGAQSLKIGRCELQPDHVFCTTHAGLQIHRAQQALLNF